MTPRWLGRTKWQQFYSFLSQLSHTSTVDCWRVAWWLVRGEIILVEIIFVDLLIVLSLQCFLKSGLSWSEAALTSPVRVRWVESAVATQWSSAQRWDSDQSWDTLYPGHHWRHMRHVLTPTPLTTDPSDSDNLPKYCQQMWANILNKHFNTDCQQCSVQLILNCLVLLLLNIQIN